MISKKDIQNMIHHVTQHGNGYKKRETVNPHREWFIGVCLFLIIAVAGSVFNAQNYVHYNALESTVVDTTTPIKEYDYDAAKTAKDIYTKKLEAFTTLSNEAPIIVEEIKVASSTDSTATSSDEVNIDSEIGTSTEEIL